MMAGQALQFSSGSSFIRQQFHPAAVSSGNSSIRQPVVVATQLANVESTTLVSRF
jgi:hypothetical protein